MWRTLLLLPILVLTALSLSAREIYVDNLGGDDHSTGDHPEFSVGPLGPVRTINKALRLASMGDHIILAKTDESYRELVCLTGERLSGMPGLPLVIEGNDAVLDGSIRVPDKAWQHDHGDVFRFKPRRSAFQQLFHEGRPLVRRKPQAGRLELAPREWALSNGWIYFRVEPGQPPQDYELSYAGLQTGITIYHAHDVEIRNLVVQGFQLDGINAHDGVRAAQLVGITARGNGRSGITVAGSSKVTIDHCVTGDNGCGQIRMEGVAAGHEVSP